MRRSVGRPAGWQRHLRMRRRQRWLLLLLLLLLRYGKMLIGFGANRDWRSGWWTWSRADWVESALVGRSVVAISGTCGSAAIERRRRRWRAASGRANDGIDREANLGFGRWGHCRSLFVAAAHLQERTGTKLTAGNLLLLLLLLFKVLHQVLVADEERCRVNGNHSRDGWRRGWGGGGWSVTFGAVATDGRRRTRWWNVGGGCQDRHVTLWRQGEGQVREHLNFELLLWELNNATTKKNKQQEATNEK